VEIKDLEETDDAAAAAAKTKKKKQTTDARAPEQIDVGYCCAAPILWMMAQDCNAVVTTMAFATIVTDRVDDWDGAMSWAADLNSIIHKAFVSIGAAQTHVESTHLILPTEVSNRLLEFKRYTEGKLPDALNKLSPFLGKVAESVGKHVADKNIEKLSKTNELITGEDFLVTKATDVKDICSSDEAGALYVAFKAHDKFVASMRKLADNLKLLAADKLAGVHKDIILEQVTQIEIGVEALTKTVAIAGTVLGNLTACQALVRDVYEDRKETRGSVCLKALAVISRKEHLVVDPKLMLYLNKAAEVIGSS